MKNIFISLVTLTMMTSVIFAGPSTSGGPKGKFEVKTCKTYDKEIKIENSTSAVWEIGTEINWGAKHGVNTGSAPCNGTPVKEKGTIIVNKASSIVPIGGILTIKLKCESPKKCGAIVKLPKLP